MKGNDASDLETLAALAREPETRKLAHGRAQVRLLWECCQIPDFRKLADDTHTNLCARVFGHIAREKRLPTDWLAGQIAALARADGDIDTLMQRLAGIRVWSYIAARADWVADALHWQGRAREVEDLLSDALHERLTSRFVDRRAAHLMRRLDEAEGRELLSAVTRRGEVVVEGHPVGHISGFLFLPDPDAVGDEKKLVLRAARRALREEMPRRVALLEAAPDEALALTPEHAITWDGVAVARLVRGPSALRPAVRMLDSEYLDGAQRERLRVRLQRYVDDRVRLELAPLFAASARGDSMPAARGRLHRLTEALGVVPADGGAAGVGGAGTSGAAGAPGGRVASGGALGFGGAASGGDVPGEALPSPDLRAALRSLGVRCGRLGLFIPALLKPRAAAMRAQLLALQRGVPVPALPAAGLVCAALPGGLAARIRARRWAGWRPARCCCGWMWRSKWRGSWAGRRAKARGRCRAAWRRGYRSSRTCCRWRCGRWGSGWCRAWGWGRASMGLRRRPCWFHCGAGGLSPVAECRSAGGTGRSRRWRC